MDQIRRLRHKHGLTLKQLAHECGIEWKALSAYERYQRQWPDEIRRRALKVMGEEAEEKLVTLSRAEVRQLKGPLARRLVQNKCLVKRACERPNLCFRTNIVHAQRGQGLVSNVPFRGAKRTERALGTAGIGRCLFDPSQSGSARWRLVSCDGPNWENQPPAYEDVYRWIPKESLPDPTFRRLVRCDSSFEALAWSQLAAAGARAVLSNPIDLGFDRYPLITSQGESPIHLWLPALHLAEHWLVFPQLTLAANWRPVRPDGLLLDWLSQRPRWSLLEIDGAHHGTHYDLRRDAALQLPVLRISSQAVTGRRFAQELDTSLKTK